MANYEFQSTLYRNSREMCLGIAGAYLSAGGLNTRYEVRRIVEELSDEWLADEVISQWGLNDDWLASRKTDRGDIVEAFATIRAHFDEFFPAENDN